MYIFFKVQDIPHQNFCSWYEPRNRHQITLYITSDCIPYNHRSEWTFSMLFVKNRKSTSKRILICSKKKKKLVDVTETCVNVPTMYAYYDKYFLFEVTNALIEKSRQSCCRFTRIQKLPCRYGIFVVWSCSLVIWWWWWLYHIIFSL